jgi:DNA primase
MEYYDQLKSRADIYSIATLLGYNGTKSGSSYQGDCPRHGSSGGKCLVIWPGIQGFHCYHCGESGDVIGLAALFKRCDHKEAVNFLADRAGLPHLGDGKLSPEETAKREADVAEEKLVNDMLTVAAEWYHKRLEDFPAIFEHLQNHYGFSREIIEELQIGFASPDTNGPSRLATWLDQNPKFKGRLALSGLFTFGSPHGPLWDYFRGRIVFPYWKGGKVVNIIARATTMTPVDQYECYSKDGNVKTDADGRHEYVKYKKLRRHDPSDGKRKHISKFIGTETFMGEDSIRGAREIIITEGAPDWVSAVDYGFAAISPVTTNFREEDFEKLAQLTSSAEAVYLINDNEENQAGLKGALKTGKYLTQQGRKVFLVILPKPDGVEKIDLNEYLKDHTAADLRKLMGEARSVLDILINDLPADFVKAQSSLKSDILPLLVGMNEGIREHYLGRIRAVVKTSRSALNAAFEEVEREAASKHVESSKPAVDPLVLSMADAIAKDPALVKRRLDMVNAAGVVGERNVAAMIFAALDSRLLPEDTASPNALAIKNAGHHGSGKSFTLKKCLEFYPEDAYHLITSGSAKSLYYLPDGLKHRALIVTEAFQFQPNNAADSEFVYVVRSLLSEGRVSYQVPQKDDDGKFVTIEMRLDGPTSFLTTTVIDKLEPQLEDRLFSIHPDESMEQTRAIMSMTARIKDGSFDGVDAKTAHTWKLFHSMLKPVGVVIPFAGQISSYIQRGSKLPIATRRAFNRVLAIIQTVTCAYQYQRSQDCKGRLVAEICDYWMALQIVREAFRENMGQQGRASEQRVEFIREGGPVHYNALKSEWGVSKSALTNWVRGKVYDNLLVWCNDYGEEFADDAALKKAKHSGTAYVKVNDAFVPDDVTGLPTPFDLTGDPRWNDGGDLFDLYDLRLDRQQVQSEASEIKSPATQTLSNEASDKNSIDVDSSDYDEFAYWGSEPTDEHKKKVWSEESYLF